MSFLFIIDDVNEGMRAFCVYALCIVMLTQMLEYATVLCPEIQAGGEGRLGRLGRLGSGGNLERCERPRPPRYCGQSGARDACHLSWRSSSAVYVNMCICMHTHEEGRHIM